MQPWERHEGEPARWFARFTAYCVRGPGRTVQAVWDAEKQTKHPGSRPTKPSKHWQEAKRNWNWDARVDAFDVEQANRARAAAEAEGAKRAAEWEQRRQQQLDAEWELRNTLLERFRAMSRFPLQTAHTTDAEGRSVVIMPIRWTFTTMVSVADAVSKLGRAATGMESGAMTLDVTSGGGELLPLTAIVEAIKQVKAEAEDVAPEA